MSDVPIGYLITVALMCWYTAFALAPPWPRQSGPSNKSHWFGYLLNEQPFFGCYWLLASTVLAFAQGDIDSPGGWATFGLAMLTTGGLAVVARRGLRAGPAVDLAIHEGLGAGWRKAIGPEASDRLRRRLPWARILIAPFLVRRHDVEHVANISHGDAGRYHLLDLYRHRSRPSACPTLVYLHGGAFRGGRKDHEALPLLYRLASQGWLCISANYRLSPSARFPDHHVDVKRVIAWVREHGAEHGADSSTVFVSGSSAGGHLAAFAAHTPNDSAFQLGFEGVDTPVAGAICLTATTAASPLMLSRPARRRPMSGPMRRRSSWHTAISTLS